MRDLLFYFLLNNCRVARRGPSPAECTAPKAIGGVSTADYDARKTCRADANFNVR